MIMRASATSILQSMKPQNNSIDYIEFQAVDLEGNELAVWSDQ